MTTSEKTLFRLGEIERIASINASDSAIDVRIMLLTTLIFIVCVLSVPLSNPVGLILFCIYPFAASAICNIPFRPIFKYSLVVLPFIAMIGIFNPILDRKIIFYVGTIPVTGGWASFISILLRGILSVQAVLILIFSYGFNRIASGLRQLYIPSVIVTQLQMVYRYIFILINESVNMDRARRARGFGKKHYPLKMWGIFIGQLLLRTIDRAERIHRAMLARGFNGTMPDICHRRRLTSRDWIYLILCTGFFMFARFVKPDILF